MKGIHCWVQTQFGVIMRANYFSFLMAIIFCKSHQNLFVPWELYHYHGPAPTSYLFLITDTRAGTGQYQVYLVQPGHNYQGQYTENIFMIQPLPPTDNLTGPEFKNIKYCPCLFLQIQHQEHTRNIFINIWEGFDFQIGLGYVDITVCVHCYRCIIQLTVMEIFRTDTCQWLWWKMFFWAKNLLRAQNNNTNFYSTNPDTAERVESPQN